MGQNQGGASVPRDALWRVPQPPLLPGTFQDLICIVAAAGRFTHICLAIDRSSGAGIWPGRKYAALDTTPGQPWFSSPRVGWRGTSEKSNEAMGAPTCTQPGGAIFASLNSAIADYPLRSPGSFACSGQNILGSDKVQLVATFVYNLQYKTPPKVQGK